MTINYKGIQLNVYGTEIYMSERTVPRTFKKSGVVVYQHYPEYKPIVHYDSKGYGRIVVSQNCKSINLLIHNIIAIAYPEICGTWFEGCIVHHKDHNPSNNDPHNLKVMSREEHDIIHQVSKLTSKRMSDGTHKHHSNFKGHRHTEQAKQLNSVKHSKPICQISENGTVVNKYQSGKECSRITGFPHSSIMKAVLSGKKRFGYYWKRL